MHHEQLVYLRKTDERVWLEVGTQRFELSEHEVQRSHVLVEALSSLNDGLARLSVPELYTESWVEVLRNMEELAASLATDRLLVCANVRFSFILMCSMHTIHLR